MFSHVGLFVTFQFLDKKGKRRKKMVGHFYNTPRYGGHQVPKTKHLSQLKLLRDFPLCRVACAFLCVDFNDRYGSSLGIQVIRVASEKTISQWKHAVAETTARRQSGMYQNAIDTCPACYMALLSEHTLVLHPVGYHVDYFGSTNWRTRTGTLRMM